MEAVFWFSHAGSCGGREATGVPNADGTSIAQVQSCSVHQIQDRKIMPNQQQPKEEVARLIRKSRRKSRDIVERASDLLQWSQYMADLSDASDKVVQYPSPSRIDWENTIGSWQHLNEQQDNILASIGPVSIERVISSGSAVAYAMTDFAKPDNLIRNVSIEKREEARSAAEQLGQVIDRLANKDRVLSLLRQFGLTSAVPTKKSPAELFEIAWAAFGKPVTQSSPVVTSLIPMRECINATIAALLRRRPKQEPAKSRPDKIVSIGSQLARDGISPADIESLADRWTKLVDELSGSKQKDCSREEWQASLRRGTLFLMEFLQSLDPAKMR